MAGSGKTKVHEAEEERRELIEQLVADEGPDWAGQYAPGSFGCHELLDRTAQIMDSVDRYLTSHPACLANPEWFALAHSSFSALFDLYQKVGAAHLPASPLSGPGD